MCFKHDAASTRGERPVQDAAWPNGVCRGGKNLPAFAFFVASDDQITFEKENFFPVVVDEWLRCISPWRDPDQPGTVTVPGTLVEVAGKDFPHAALWITRDVFPPVFHVDFEKFSMFSRHRLALILEYGEHGDSALCLLSHILYSRRSALPTTEANTRPCLNSRSLNSSCTKPSLPILQSLGTCWRRRRRKSGRSPPPRRNRCAPSTCCGCKAGTRRSRITSAASTSTVRDALTASKGGGVTPASTAREPEFLPRRYSRAPEHRGTPRRLAPGRLLCVSPPRPACPASSWRNRWRRGVRAAVRWVRRAPG